MGTITGFPLSALKNEMSLSFLTDFETHYPWDEEGTYYSIQTVRKVSVLLS